MSTDGVVLGIDTSNYTTSVALVGVGGELIANIKRPLAVKSGECGLRQSDAVFSHVKNLPSAMEQMKEELGERRIVAVGVSTRPRNIEGSYMPCFLSGLATANGISAALGVPMYSFSHQCGHIMAALYSSGRTIPHGGEFAAFHVSGGTTELVRVRRTECGFDTEIVGGTRDLNAGQVIDRIGVRLGLRFPAGAALEELALGYNGKVKHRRPSLDGTYVNLSGLENLAVKLYEETNDPAATAAFVLEHVAEALGGMAEAFISRYGEMPLVFAGGVMSNSIIKKRLADRLGDVSFAEPMLSADNAVGVAVLARERYASEVDHDR